MTSTVLAVISSGAAAEAPLKENPGTATPVVSEHFHHGLAAAIR
jgi:hypothetical protein